jgi:hypothetical protein
MSENHLLIFHQGALGDFVVTFPILKALRAVFPRIDGICRSSFGRLAVDLGVLDASYPLESARFASLYADRIDPVVVTLVSAYSSLVLFSFSELLEGSLRKIGGCRVFRILPWPTVSQKSHITEFLVRQVLTGDLMGKQGRRRFARALEPSATMRGEPAAAVHGSSSVPEREVLQNVGRWKIFWWSRQKRKSAACSRRSCWARRKSISKRWCKTTRNLTPTSLNPEHFKN